MIFFKKSLMIRDVCFFSSLPAFQMRSADGFVGIQGKLLSGDEPARTSKWN